MIGRVTSPHSLTCQVCVLLVVLLGCGSVSPVSAARCAPGTASFALVQASPARCQGSAVAVLWPTIHVNLNADCSWNATVGMDKVRGIKNKDLVYRSPTSPTVSFPIGNGQTGVWRTYGFALSLIPFQGASSHYDPDVTLYTSYDRDVYPGVQYRSPLNDFESAFGATFKGLAYGLGLNALPPRLNGYRAMFTPGNYTFRRAGRGGFEALSPFDKCTLRYRMVAGSFPEFELEGCKEGSSPDCPASCPAGYGRVPLTGVPGSICAPCPAGTSGPGGAAAKCTPCPAGLVATRVGTPKCEICYPRGFVPLPGATACAACSEDAEQIACFAGSRCPKGTVGDGLGNCVTGARDGTGKLCVAAAAPSAPAVGPDLKCSAEVVKAAAGSTDGMLAGADAGAVIRLQGGLRNSTGANCTTYVGRLAKELAGKLSWIGFPANSSQAVKWLKMKEPNRVSDEGVLPPAGFCGLGPDNFGVGSPESYVLGARAVRFGTAFTQGFGLSYESVGFGAIVSPGAAPGTLDAVFYFDGTHGPVSCLMTALTFADADLCTAKLTFQVVAGSFLGVKGPPSAPCPAGTLTNKAGTTCALVTPTGRKSAGAGR